MIYDSGKGIELAIEYKSIEYRLHECLVRIQEYINLLEFDPDLVTPILQSKELLKTKKYTVAVMGEFKRGKSSLINALLGSPILPADATPTTATVNRITYGSEPETVITYKDGTSQNIEIGELSQYVTKLTADGKARAQLIKEATVYFPIHLCQNHVDIIDTPGLNDDEYMTQITIGLLNQVDGIVVPLHAKIPFSDTEKKFVLQLIKSEKVGALFFVITFMDQLDDDDYQYDAYMEYIKQRIQEGVFSELAVNPEDEKWLKKSHELLDGLNIIGVSSSLALKSFATNNQKDLRSSRFEDFKNYLIQTITARQLENAVEKSIEIVEKTISQFDFQNQKKLAAYNLDAKDLEDAQKSSFAYSAGIKKFLDSVFLDNYGNLDDILKKNNTIKNTMVSEFVKELSALKIDSHDKVQQALNNAMVKVNHFLEEKSSSTRDQLLQLLTSDLKRIDAFRKHSLTHSFEKLKIKDEFSVDKIIEFMKSDLGEIKFCWISSPIPDVDDLSQCNVIATVIQAIDVSITKWLEDYQRFLVGIRKNWFSEMAGDAEQNKTKAAEQYVILSDQLDMKVKAHIKNYQVVSKNSTEELAKCQTLQQELFSRAYGK